MADSNDTLPEQFLKGEASGRNLLRNIWTHDLVERLKLRRRVIAKDGQLTGDDMDIDVGAYPGRNTVVATQRGGQLGMILGTVAATLLGGAAAGLGMNALGLLKPHQTVVSEEVKEKPYNVIFDVDSDGTITPVEVEPRE